MSDLYTELLVQKKSSMALKALKVILAVLTAIAAVLAIMTMNLVLIVAAFVFAIGWCLVRQNSDVEFEYLQVNDEIDIDKICNKNKRKRVLSIDLKSVEVAAPLGSHALDSYQKLKVADYSAQDPNEKPYVLICKADKEMKQVLLQLDQKMVKNLKNRMPRKLIEY